MSIHVKDTAGVKVIAQDDKLRIVGNCLLTSLIQGDIKCEGKLFGDKGIDTKYNLLKYALISSSLVLCGRGTSVNADSYNNVCMTSLSGIPAFDWYQLSIINSYPAPVSDFFTNNILFTGKLVDGYRNTNVLLQFDLLLIKRPEVYLTEMYEDVHPPYPNKG